MKRFQSIEAKLIKSFAPVYMEIVNESSQHNVPIGSETHFKVVIVSESFKAASRIDRQRLVNQCLVEEFQQGLHALTQRTFTPEEWDQVKDQFQMQSPECLGGSKN